MPEEFPRFHRINADCCDRHIVHFDLPSRAPVGLAESAVRNGWELGGDGKWTCPEHKERVIPSSREPVYEAVREVIRSLPQERLSPVERNAAIWRAVHAALAVVEAAELDRVLQEAEETLRAWGEDGDKRKSGTPSPFYMWEDADRAADLIADLRRRA